MKNIGWIKIHRQIKEKGWSNSPDYFALWFHLLLLANHKEKEWLWNGSIYHCKPGQFITSRKELAKVSGINEHKVDRILKLFKSEQQIEQQTTSKNRLITIINWNKYQQLEQHFEQQVSNNCATNEQQMSTTKECNNIKNEKNEKDIPIGIEQAQFSKKSFKKNLKKNSSNTLKEIFSPTPPVPAPPPEYGNEEINRMLVALKGKIGIEDFADTQKWSRVYARHCCNLITRIGKDEFVRRLDLLLEDEFHSKNCNKIKYVYNNIKGFKEPKNNNIII